MNSRNRTHFLFRSVDTSTVFAYVTMTDRHVLSLPTMLLAAVSAVLRSIAHHLCVDYSDIFKEKVKIRIMNVTNEKKPSEYKRVVNTKSLTN